MIFRITGAVTLLLLMGSNGFAQQPQVMPLEDCLKLSCGQYDCSDACCSTGCKRIGRCGQPLGCGGAGCGCGQGGSCDACDAGRCTSCASDCSGSCGGGCAGDCAATTCCKKYFRTYFGWNAVQDYAGEVVVAPANLSGSFNEGWSLSFACGRYFQPGRRFELEFAYRNNSGDIWTSTSGPVVVPFDGQINSYSVMGNVLLDINRLSLGG